MRKSKQREIILDIINNSSEHPSAYVIYEKARETLPNISLGTVYRNLKALESTNEINVVFDGLDKLRYDKKENHHHFICTKCRRIIDVYDLRLNIPKKYNQNTVMDYKLVLEGICEKCQKEE